MWSPDRWWVSNRSWISSRSWLCSRSWWRSRARAPRVALGIVALTLTVAASPAARAVLPAWLQHVVGASRLDAALYRAMQLPGTRVLYPRPPGEAREQLGRLAPTGPDASELYRLRALADEQALDETAATADWKLYAAHAPDPAAGILLLADFYARRMLYPEELAALRMVAAAPTPPAELYLEPSRQRSWRALERILSRIAAQGMPAEATAGTFDAFLARYPAEPSVYAAALQFNVEQHRWDAAAAVIARYRQKFPDDTGFPVRAEALLSLRRDGADAALRVYDRGFQPLWSQELVRSYMALLDSTHRRRQFVASAREQLRSHPEGPAALNALARVFYYDQAAGRNSAALETLAAFRVNREARGGAWSADDLDTMAQLSALAGSPSEAARYEYALASTPGAVAGGEAAAQRGLAGLVRILLTAPEQPLAISSANLSLYRDIATLDGGPGYWNGILSLWLNGTDPESAYAAAETGAGGYFDHAKAAELLASLDRRFPAAAERAPLHAALIAALAEYGQPEAVVRAGQQYLQDFADAPERLQVADTLADAYAQLDNATGEFALYESQLRELAAKSGGMPLTAAATAPPAAPGPGTAEFEVSVQNPDSVDADAAPALQVTSEPLAMPPARKTLPAATAYAHVLDRYLGRLTATGQLPRALVVLRQQLDRNPDDPLLYERLSAFLQQNDLSAGQEAVFRLAIRRFGQPGYYGKLARFYLRTQRRVAFAQLVRQVTGIFSGTELDSFFTNVTPAKPVGPQLALELNLYAAQRFPHDVVFTRNLLTAYRAKATRNPVAYEALLRRQWWLADDLRDEFLGYLSRTGKLPAELATLEAASRTSPTAVAADPAAVREQAEIDIFTSRFEQAAPLLGSVATLYAADADAGDRAVSLYRSLAYLDPTSASTEHAVAVEKQLLRAAPDSPDRLATLGDLYAEATSTGGEDIAAAAPYWRRIPELHPGSSGGFLTSATIFWDYFQFNDALLELRQARDRLHAAALFDYEAGAIAENQRDLPRAVREYTDAAVHPLEPERHFDSGIGVIKAWLSPPSDAADSHLQSTAQSFLGSEAARTRLLQLASRENAAATVDAATSKAVDAEPANTAALTLRADVLTAQHPPAERKALLGELFIHALGRASTLDEAAAVGELAQARGLTVVYQQALGRQVQLAADPVGRIELQYTLARSLEAAGDVAGATRLVGEVYAANPRLLGVVRTTVEFYARTHQPTRAIGTLLDASKVATPFLAREFTLEAANRANEAGDTAQARSLGLGLLNDSPYDARVLSVVAESYARAQDDAGLKQFYLARLALAAADTTVSADVRKADVALLRRGLIPALTRLRAYGEATAQYTSLLAAYPEDIGTGQQADLYALRYGTQAQLLQFLETTVGQSPRDSRFAVLLAGAQTTFGDLPAAEAAYTAAIGIRKDRADLYAARAEIETRLSQTDPAESERAAADYARLYLLSYHDPAWMLRLAELRARQGQPDAAVEALRTAYITGHAENAADHFRVADQLAAWNLLPQARAFAERAVVLAGTALLTPPESYAFENTPSGAAIYARVLARSGDAKAALTTLAAARDAADADADSPRMLAAALAKENIIGDDAAEFRKSFAARQRQTADRTLQGAVGALGDAVQTFYTPEGKLQFAQMLDTLHDPAQSHANPKIALQAAIAAGLSDREAAWRAEALLTGSLPAANVEAYTKLERQRLQFSELAQTLEKYAARLKPDARKAPLGTAAGAYRDAGDLTGEARVSRELVAAGDTGVQDRYLDLLLHHDPAALLSLAAGKEKTLAEAAVNFAIAHGNETQALAAVRARGAALPAVWRPAVASLVQTYFSSGETRAADIADFTGPLAASATVAERVAARPDPANHIAGDEYFFYSSRFGIFLATVPKASGLPDSEDFLPAGLEGAPTAAASYLDLARTYREAKNVPAAEAEYMHALELAPADPAVLDELAVMLYAAGQAPRAAAEWSAALVELRNMQAQGSYPEVWFTSLEAIVAHLGERQLTAKFHAELEAILRPYFAKNGAYRSNELLRSVYTASATPADGAAFVLELAGAATDPGAVLADLRGAAWLPASAREAILERQLALARTAPPANAGSPEAAAEDSSAPADRQSLERSLITLYLEGGKIAEAQKTLDALPAGDRDAAVDLRVELAVRTGHLQQLLDGWHADADTAPTAEKLQLAISSLQTATPAYKPDPAAIRPLIEFAFERKDREGSLQAIDYVSLAQSRLDTGNLATTVKLLQRLALAPATAELSGSGMDVAASTEAAASAGAYANVDRAAELLEHNLQPAAAVPFLRSLARLLPWEPAYRLRLAQALAASGNGAEAATIFRPLAADNTAPYALRVRAARALHDADATGVTGLGSAELAFLAMPAGEDAARQPYFAAARLAAAEMPSVTDDARQRLLCEAVAIQPLAPDADRARVRLIMLQAHSGDPAVTLALFRSLGGTLPSGGAMAEAAPATDANLAVDDAATTVELLQTDTGGKTEAASVLPAVLNGLDDATRYDVAMQLSRAAEGVDEPGAALAFAEAAAGITGTGNKPHPELPGRIRALRVAIQLAERNPLRRPVVGDTLAQPVRVRPRLTTADFRGQEAR